MIGRRRDLVFVGLLLLLGVALRITSLGAPPLDAHHIRQADTASMARVMFREGIDVFTPRIAWAGPEAGPVEAEFPLYPALVAGGWRRLGEPLGVIPSASAAWARGVSVAAWLFGALALTAWVRRRLPGPAWPHLILYAVSPAAVVFTRNIQPDSLAVALLLIGLDRLDASLDRERAGALETAVAAVTLGLALAVKPTVGFWLLAVVPVALAEGVRSSRFLRGFGAVVGALGLAAGWYFHAASLGVDGATFGIWGAAAHKWGGPAVWSDAEAWLAILAPLLVATLTPLGASLALVGVYFLMRVPEGRGFAFGVVALVPAVVIATEGFALHAYYQLPLVAFASVCAGRGLQKAVMAARGFPSSVGLPGFVRALSLALAAAALVASVIFGVGYVSDGLRLDPRPARIAREARPHIPPGASVVVVDRHPQTVLFALDRRGWVRSSDHGGDLGGWARLGADWILVGDGVVAGVEYPVALGDGWALYRP